MRRTHGNVIDGAFLLGVHRQTLYTKLKKKSYGMKGGAVLNEWIKIIFRYLVVALVGFGLGYLYKGERRALNEKIKIGLRYVLAIAVGFGLGYLYESERLAHDPDEQVWQSRMSEEPNHKRILKFQDTMETLQAHGAKDADDLTKQLDAQLRIEDLVLKSREAEYAKWLPFTPLLTGGLGAALGFLTALLGWKPRGSRAPDSR